MKEKENICRLCRTIDAERYLDVEAYTFQKVKEILPELSVDPTNKFSICSKCKEVLDDAFELKQVFTKNTNVIRYQQVNNAPVDLNDWPGGNGTEFSGNICRICLERNEGNYINLNEENGEFKKVVECCIPELDPHLTLNTAVCSVCQTTLFKIYDLKKDCLSIEAKIKLDNKGTGPQTNVDRKNVATESKQEDDDFLSGFEVQDEEAFDIFDNFPNFIENYDKHSDTDSTRREGSLKNLDTDRALINNEELPPFQFNLNLLYHNKNHNVVQEWVAVVDEYKHKFNWSDYATIRKVLERLKSLSQLYVWFSSIADVMNWEQWKQKLIQAFPPKYDYCLLVKNMISRKKMKDETFVSYFDHKVALMEKLNLTIEQQMSCVLGGITDAFISCIGRVGNYQTLDDLLDYLKSCDEKQKVEAEEKQTPLNKQFTPPKQKQFADKVCYLCNKAGHVFINCPHNNSKVQNNLVKQSPLKQQVVPPRQSKLTEKKSKACYICNKVGHTYFNCFYYKSQNNADTETLNRQFIPPGQNQFPKGDMMCTVCKKVGHMYLACRFYKDKAGNNLNIETPLNQQFTSPICTICNTVGHTDSTCRYNSTVQDNLKTETLNLPLKPPKPPKLLVKKKRCTDCKRSGHTYVECRQYQVAAHLDRIGQLKIQDNPHISQALARPTNKTRSANFPSSRLPSAVSKEEDCAATSQPMPSYYMLQHNYESQTPIDLQQHQPEWPNSLQELKSPRPPRIRKRKRNTDYDLSRCRDCGRFGSKATPCCSAGTSHKKAYIGSYDHQDDNKQLCLKCYQVGHSTMNCHSD